VWRRSPRWDTKNGLKIGVSTKGGDGEGREKKTKRTVYRFFIRTSEDTERGVPTEEECVDRPTRLWTGRKRWSGGTGIPA